MSPLLRFLLLGLVVLTMARWAAAAVWEVSPDEAYLYQLMRHRVFVGCDGGGVAALFAGTAMFGKSALALRFFAPLIAASASLMFFRLLVSLAGERGAAWGVVLLNLLPSFNQGAIQLMPEWIAAYFAMGGMALLWKALHKSGKFDWRWPATGVLWGLALMSHPSALLLPVGLLFLFGVSRRWRGRLLRPSFWLLLLGWFVVGLLPLLIWNATHANSLMDRWLEEFGWRNKGWFHFDHAWQLLVQALGGISPLLLAGALWAAWKTLRAIARDDAAYFLISFLLPVLAVVLFGGLLGLGNFTMLVPAIPVMLALTIHHWQPRSAIRDRQSIWQWSALALAAVMSLALLNTDLPRRAGIISGYRWDPTRSVRGWEATAKEAAAIVNEASVDSPEGLLLIAETPELAAALDFHLPADQFLLRPDPAWPRVQVMESPVATSEYAFWPRYDSEPAPEATVAPPVLLGKTALFFTEVENRHGPPTMISHTFGSVEPLMIYEVRRHEGLLRTIRVFVCRDYQGSPL